MLIFLSIGFLVALTIPDNNSIANNKLVMVDEKKEPVNAANAEEC